MSMSNLVGGGGAAGFGWREEGRMARSVLAREFKSWKRYSIVTKILPIQVVFLREASPLIPLGGGR